MLTMTKTLYIVFVELSGVFNGSKSAYFKHIKKQPCSTKTTSLEIFHGDRRRVVHTGRMVLKGCPFINDGMAAAQVFNSAILQYSSTPCTRVRTRVRTRVLQYVRVYTCTYAYVYS